MGRFFGRSKDEQAEYTEDDFEVMNLDEEYEETDEVSEDDDADEEIEFYEIEDSEEEADYEEEEIEESENDIEYYELEEDEEYYEAEEDVEYYEQDEMEDEEYYETEEESEDETYYEMDEYGDEYYEDEYYEDAYDEDEKSRGVGNVIGRVIAFLSNMSSMDRLIASTGALVLIFAIVAGSMFASAKAGERQVAAFANLGTELDDIGVIGESGLLAVSDAKLAKQEAAMLAEEEMKETEEETEETKVGEIQVSMNLSSIQQDLKIKFINKKSGKLIASVPFEVEVVDADKKTYTLIDEDMDGIIYQKGLKAGKFQVAMVKLEGYEEYDISTESQNVTVKDKIEYKKVDVADEIKTEAEVNAAAEDTKVQEIVVESTVQDTVAFVESTKTEIADGNSYKEINKSTITDPSTVASAPRLSSFLRLSAATETTTPTENEPSTPQEPQTPVAPTIALNSSSVAIEAGQTVQLSATISDGVVVTWASSNSAVAVVDGNGLVSGAGAGTATITATVTGAGGTASATCTVSVAAPVIPTTVELNTSSTSVYTGQTIQLVATINDGSVVTWTSSDSSVASVDGNGLVTGLKSGTVTITASANGTSATCTVNISSTGTTISASSLSLKVGEKATLTASVTGANSSVTWTSSDSSVAGVDGSGVVTAQKAGTATITATANGVSATCSVTVTAEAVNDAKNDTKTALKDNNGNQVYIKNAAGEYVAAVYADYYKYDKFYIKSAAYKYTGWQTIEGSVYYYDANGNVVKGTQIIQGATYNFDKDTGALIASSGVLGIDVSKWNGDIDWNAVKNSGVNYVIIRCGYRGSSTGALIEDPKFRANIKGASAAGLKVGIYFFTQAVNEVEAVEEASMVLSLISGYKISYPVFLDVEASGGRADAISAEVRTAVCNAFCQTIANSGYATGIYANKTWLNSKINTGSLGSSYKIWLAQYAAQPSYGGKYHMWQYTSKGSVNGIKGNVDMNLSYLGY